jgi:hypothetical protein
MNKSCLRSALGGLALLMLMMGAGPAAAQEPEQAPQTEIFFKRLAVAPVLVGHRTPNMDETLDDTLSCTISQICVDDPAIAPQAGTMLTRLIQSVLTLRFGPNVVPADEVQTAYAALRLNGSKDTPRELAQRLASMLGADLMVVGTVWRYRDRGAIEGFPEKPASVAFAVYLVDPETGRRVWRKIFDETQEFALKDMSKFTDRMKMGLKWLSVDELARYGVKVAFNAFPNSVIPIREEKTSERPAP